MTRRLWIASTALGLVGALAGMTGLALAGTPADDTIEVRTDAGPVRGVVGPGHRTFAGIPYAAPPVGDLRWRAPQPVTPWTTPPKVPKPGPLCAQDGEHLGERSVAEDCLYLTVTTPARSAGPARRPVLVWLHGGSFKDGGGRLYPAYRLAERGDAVVVTINYRLGALGFLAHPLLRDAGVSGGFGLADQQAALRWVQRNAAAFGGDPANVTLAGESAGAISICAHLAAPTSAGLFHRAIMQSGPCIPSSSAGAGSDAGSRSRAAAGSDAGPHFSADVESGNDPHAEAVAGSGNGPRSRAVAEEQGRRFVAALGLGPAPTAGQLRDPKLVSPDKLLAAAAAAGSSFGPVYGDGLLPIDPARAITSGRMNRVPVLHGINRDEQRLQVWGYEMAKYQGPLPAGEYAAEIRAAFGADAARVLRAYPLRRYGLASHAFAAVLTDAEHAASTVASTAALSRRVPTFTYEFADDDAPWFSAFPEPYPMGAYHAAELPYLFDVAGTEPLTPAQERLADRMIGYWAAFARGGDPNTPGAPVWRRSGPRRPAVQQLAPGPQGIGPVNFAAAHRYALWSKVRR